MDYKSHRSLIKAAIQSKRRSLLNEQDAMLAGAGVKPNPLLDPRAAQQTQEEVARIEQARSALMASKERQDKERDLTLLHLNPQRAEVIYSIGLGKEVDPNKLKTLSPEIEKEFQTPTIFPTGQDGRAVAGSDPRYAEGLLRGLGQLSKGEEAFISVLRNKQAEAEFYGTGQEHASKVMMAMGPAVALTQVNWQSRTKPTPTDLGKSVKAGNTIQDLVGEDYRFRTDWIDDAVAANPDLFDEETLKKAMDTLPSTPSARNKANLEAREQIQKYIETRQKRRTAQRDLSVAELTDFVLGDVDGRRNAFEPVFSKDMRTGGAATAPKQYLTASDQIAQKQLLIQLAAQRHDLELGGKGLSKDPVKLVADSIGLNYDPTRGYRIDKDIPLTLTEKGFQIDVEKARTELGIRGSIPNQDKIIENIAGINRELQKDARAEVSKKMERLFDLAYADAVDASKDKRIAGNLPSSVDTRGAKPAIVGDMSEAVRESLRDQLLRQANEATPANLDQILDFYDNKDAAAISARRQGLWKTMSELQYTNTEVDSSGRIVKIRDTQTDLQKARKIIDVATGYTDTMGKTKVARPTITDRPTLDASGNVVRTAQPENFDLDTFFKSNTLVWDPTTKQWEFFEDSSRILKPLGPDFSIQTAGLSPEHEKLIQRIRMDYGDAPETTPMGRAVKKSIEVAKTLMPGAAGFIAGAGTAFLTNNIPGVDIPSPIKSGVSTGVATGVTDYLENKKSRIKPDSWTKWKRIGLGAGEGMLADYAVKALGLEGNETTELVGTAAGLAGIPLGLRAAATTARVIPTGPAAEITQVAVPLGLELLARGAAKAFEPRKKTPLEERMPEVAEGMSKEQLDKFEERRKQIVMDYQELAQLAKANNMPFIKKIPENLDISGLNLKSGQAIYPGTKDFEEYMKAVLRHEANKLKTPPKSPNVNESWYPNPRFR